MKLGLLLVVVAVVLGGLIGTLVVRDPGYILVSYADMAVETSLWFGLLVLLALYLLIRSFMFIFSRSLSTTNRFGVGCSSAGAETLNNRLCRDCC